MNSSKTTLGLTSQRLQVIREVERLSITQSEACRERSSQSKKYDAFAIKKKRSQKLKEVSHTGLGVATCRPSDQSLSGRITMWLTSQFLSQETHKSWLNMHHKVLEDTAL